jgi:hypothetical protein
MPPPPGLAVYIPYPSPYQFGDYLVMDYYTLIVSCFAVNQADQQVPAASLGAHLSNQVAQYHDVSAAQGCHFVHTQVSI